MSVINYAVDHLKIKHIVVCGHYYCGGVQAAMESKDMGIINPWLRNVRDVYRLHKLELNNIEDEEQKYKRLVELNVQEQCVNVLKTAVVQRAYKERNVQVHGWVWDMHSGKLINLNVDYDKIMEGIMEIYCLK
jgi:carbonic anhydrase